jgi:hypothetical protein
MVSAEIDIELPDLGEPFDQEITFNRIRNAFSNGHYDLAIHLSLEKLYITARQKLTDEKTIAVIVSKAAEKLEEIVNRNDLTRDEKGEEVVKVIVSTLEPYEFITSDALGISLKHSIEYGASFLSWNNRTKFTKCKGLYVKTIIREVCDMYGCHDEQYYIPEYRDEYVTQVPDYYIYRVVDGQQKLLTKIKGYANLKFNTFGLSSDDGWTDLVVNAFNYYRNIPEATVEEDRLFWLDLHSDVRSLGESLSYKVVADLKPYKIKDCGSNDQFSSTISADADGDGKMDFIPSRAYDKYFGKYYGWLVPVIAFN